MVFKSANGKLLKFGKTNHILLSAALVNTAVSVLDATNLPVDSSDGSIAIIGGETDTTVLTNCISVTDLPTTNVRDGTIAIITEN